MAKNHNPDGLGAATEKKTRPVNVYDLPPSLANGIQSIGLVTLSSEEELQAWKRSRGESARLATELVKTSIVEVNGQALKLADGSVDTFWKDLDPRVRQLVLSAYQELHSAQEEDVGAFLASRKVKVG